jgi:hypothetical protein
MNNCEAIRALGGFDFESRAFSVVSLASGLAANAKSHGSSLAFALSLYRINSKLETTLNDFHDIMEGKKPAPAPLGEPLTVERIENAAETFDFCYRMIEYIYEGARRAGFTNRTLTAGSLSSLKNHNEELLDIATWLEDLAHPKQVKRIFERADKETEYGELYDISKV